MRTARTHHLYQMHANLSVTFNNLTVDKHLSLSLSLSLVSQETFTFSLNSFSNWIGCIAENSQHPLCARLKKDLGLTMLAEVSRRNITQV